MLTAAETPVDSPAYHSLYIHTDLQLASDHNNFSLNNNFESSETVFLNIKQVFYYHSIRNTTLVFLLVFVINVRSTIPI